MSYIDYIDYIPDTTTIFKPLLRKKSASNSYRMIPLNMADGFAKIGAESYISTPLSIHTIPSANLQQMEIEGMQYASGITCNAGDIVYEMDTYRKFKYAKDEPLVVTAANFEQMHPALVDTLDDTRKNSNIWVNAGIINPLSYSLSRAKPTFSEGDLQNVFNAIINLDITTENIYLIYKIKMKTTPENKYNCNLFIEGINADTLEIVDGYNNYVKDVIECNFKDKLFLKQLPVIHDQVGYEMRFYKKVANIGIDYPMLQPGKWKNFYGFSISDGYAYADGSKSSIAFGNSMGYGNDNYLHTVGKDANNVVIKVKIEEYNAGDVQVSYGGNTSALFSGNGIHVVTLPYSATDDTLTVQGKNNLDAKITYIQCFADDLEYLESLMPYCKSALFVDEGISIGKPKTNILQSPVVEYQELLADGLNKTIVHKIYNTFSGTIFVKPINLRQTQYTLYDAMQDNCILHFGIKTEADDQAVFNAYIDFDFPIEIANTTEIKINGQSLPFILKSSSVAPDSTNGYPI